MSDLTEFLMARVVEDEAVAPEWRYDEGLGAGRIRTVTIPGGVPSPRVLAECEAKRRIVVRLATCAACADEGNRYEARVLGWVMAILALPYAEHPDFREEWRA